MPFILIYILCFLVTFFPSPYSFAEETGFISSEEDVVAETNFGLAMTGMPNQSIEDPHLSYADPTAKSGGHLKQSEIGTFNTVNPYSIKGKAAAGLNLIYDRLMARSWDEPFTLYPLIAEKIDVAEDKASMTIHLNPDAKFNDGTQITADDLVFSFNILKEKGRPNMRSVYKQVAEFSKADDLTINVALGPTHNQETHMIIAMMPVLSKDWWSERDFEATLLEMPNASGPYIIKEVNPGSKITYEKNSNYWAKDSFAKKGLHHFETVSFDYFRDDTAALESFMKGDLNLRRENDPRKWAEQYNSESIEKLEFEHGRPQRAEALIFNLRNPLFNDLTVRQALFLAFDADWIKENFFQSHLQRTNSYFPNSILSADKKLLGEDLTKRERLQKAQSLLQDAGWSIQNNKLMKEGSVFEFEILINQSKYEKIVLSFVQSLKRLGITTNIRVLDSATFQNRLLDYDYDMILHRWQNSLSPGTEQMVYWSCDSAKQKGRFNYAGICTPEIDSLAEKIAEISSYDELIENVQKLDAELIHNFISIPLFYNDKDYIAVQKNTFNIPEKGSLYGPIIESWSIIE